MAFVKLFSPEGGAALPVADVIRRLEDEFFGTPDEVDGAARPLVERAASVLGYTMFEG
jgi:hypothetical protein